MREVFLGNDYSIIELRRNGVFEYYVANCDAGDLLFSFGVKDRFSDIAIINLYNSGYFDIEIERFEGGENNN